MPCYAHNDIGLMTISRAGTASVQAACPWPQVSLAEYADIPNRVAFLREPHARMEASYGLHLERSFDLPLESFADFVSRVCTVWQTDPHIVGQFCQCHYGSFPADPHCQMGL